MSEYSAVNTLRRALIALSVFSEKHTSLTYSLDIFNYCTLVAISLKSNELGQVEKMLFFYSFSVQHQIYFAAVTDAITYALNINGDCDHKEITQKKT